MDGRTRLTVQDIEAMKPIMKMQNLPVTRVIWRAMPDLNTGLKFWILAGGAHHTVISYAANAQMRADWAEMIQIEFVHINKETKIDSFRQNLFLANFARRFRA